MIYMHTETFQPWLTGTLQAAVSNAREFVATG